MRVLISLLKNLTAKITAALIVRCSHCGASVTNWKNGMTYWQFGENGRPTRVDGRLIAVIIRQRENLIKFIRNYKYFFPSRNLKTMEKPQIAKALSGGTKAAMPKTVASGYINLGKSRTITIPKDTAPNMPNALILQGNATVKNDIWSTTLPADIKSSPVPCFKTWGNLFDPQGGKCN